MKRPSSTPPPSPPNHASPEDLAQATEQLKKHQQALAEWLETQREFEDFVVKNVSMALWVDQPSDDLTKRQRATVMNFTNTLGFEAVVAFAHYTGEKNIWSYWGTWRYFCGCCWKAIKEEGE